MMHKTSHFHAFCSRINLNHIIVLSIETNILYLSDIAVENALTEIIYDARKMVSDQFSGMVDDAIAKLRRPIKSSDAK